MERIPIISLSEYLAVMGSSMSTSALEPLQKLSGSAPIAVEDHEMWEQLFALKLPLSSAKELHAASLFFCTEMVRNNPVSGNLQTLIRRLIEQLYLACRPSAPVAHVHAACGGVYLLRLFLKHMVETLEPADLLVHLSDDVDGGGGPAMLAHPLAEALLATLVQSPLSDDSYWLHMEACTALSVCMGPSHQLFHPSSHTHSHAAPLLLHS